jgi:hypothetical protein
MASRARVVSRPRCGVHSTCAEAIANVSNITQSGHATRGTYRIQGSSQVICDSINSPRNMSRR